MPSLGSSSHPLLPLNTARLTLRPLTPDDAHSLPALCKTDPDTAARWLSWTLASYHEHARLYQPPFGEIAITVTPTGTLVGLLGLVPSLAPFKLLPAFRAQGEPPSSHFTPEVGLYWAIHPDRRRLGYAREAAAAFIAAAFVKLHLARLVATTTHDNVASQAVMRSLGMSLHTPPTELADVTPPWFQTVGLLHRPLFL